MVNVIGMGYIGLPTALIIASAGKEVTGSDIKEDVVDSLNAGSLTFEETGITDLYKTAVENGIVFKTGCVEADIYIVAVPTPYIESSKKIDACYIERAVLEILPICRDGAVIVIESTVSPGTIDSVIRPIIKQSSNKVVHIAHAPERIIPGNMLHELVNNSRTIGVDSFKTGDALKKLYGSFCKGEIILTDIRTAEMTKVVENIFRDINIALANELAKICRFGDMDVYEIISIANKHPRVNILSPGPGVGGHCISVDPWFLVGDYPGLANIILAARKINDSMPEFVLKRIRDIMDLHSIKICRVGLYGLTYKENVDDTRESPTLQLLECMRLHLAESLKVYDPYVKVNTVENQYHSLEKFLEAVDLVVIMVGHLEIMEKEGTLSDKIILDTRNILGDREGVYHL